MYHVVHQAGNRIEIELSGSITQTDLNELSRDLNRLVTRHDKLRIHCRMSEAEGWEGLQALMHDLKLDLRYNPSVERFAVVGNENWQKWVTQLMKPFAHGEVRYFDEAKLEQARAWITEPAAEIR